MDDAKSALRELCEAVERFIEADKAYVRIPDVINCDVYSDEGEAVYTRWYDAGRHLLTLARRYGAKIPGGGAG